MKIHYRIKVKSHWWYPSEEDTYRFLCGAAYFIHPNHFPSDRYYTSREDNQNYWNHSTLDYYKVTCANCLKSIETQTRKWFTNVE